MFRMSRKRLWIGLISVGVLLTAVVYFVDANLAVRAKGSGEHPLQEVGGMFDLYLPSVRQTYPLPLTNFGVQMTKIDETKGLNQAVEGGFGWVRFNTIRWDEIEPVNNDPAIYDWSSVDEVSLLNAVDNDLSVIALVLFSPDWAHEASGLSCGPIDSEDLDDFAEFMGAVVARYSQPPYHIKYWEMGNEPDIAASLVPSDNGFGCWGDEDDPFYGGWYYAEMLKVVYPAIKQADPEAQVLVGGLLLDCDPNTPGACDGSIHGVRPPKFLEGILDNDGGAYFDGVAFHPYSFYEGSLGLYSNTNWNSGSAERGPVLVEKADYLEALLQQYGVLDKYLVSTETALLCLSQPCGTDFEETKAYYAAQSHAASLAHDLEANIWYSLTHNWRQNGLLEPNLTKLPAYDAMWFARRELPNTVVYLGEVQSEDIGGVSGVRGYKFIRSDRTVWILWSQSGETNIGLTRNPHAFYDVYGNPLVKSNTITLGVAPIYIEFIP